MGKLHSKLSSKRRQSPEGGVLPSSLLKCQREFESISSSKEKNMCRNVKSNNCPLKVALPAEQGLDTSKTVLNIHSNGQERSTFPDDTGQEWLFTLCQERDSGNEDMSNFLHGVCKAIDSSLRPASNSTTAFKIKIVLSSSDDQHKVPQTDKKHSPSEETGRPVRRLYCAGENIERRNHYLDLAGIENFNSKFDNEEYTSQKPLSPHQHHPVVTSDNCTHPQTSPSLPVLNSLKTKPVWKEEKSSRLHVPHPASQCPPSHFKHTVNGPVHRSHSKRLRLQDHASPRQPVCCYGHAGRDNDVLSQIHLRPCSPLVRHHHLHEHHHHHHHHHHQTAQGALKTHPHPLLTTK